MPKLHWITYVKDTKLAPGTPGNEEEAFFDGWLGITARIITNKTFRDAIVANRFRHVVTEGSREEIKRIKQMAERSRTA